MTVLVDVTEGIIGKLFGSATKLIAGSSGSRLTDLRSEIGLSRFLASKDVERNTSSFISVPICFD